MKLIILSGYILVINDHKMFVFEFKWVNISIWLEVHNNKLGYYYFFIPLIYQWFATAIVAFDKIAFIQTATTLC